MAPSTPSLSVKAPQAIQPTSFNEHILVLSTQYNALHEAVDILRNEVGGVRKDITDLNDSLSDLDKRLSFEERDKKILVGFVVVGLPIILTVIQIFIN